MGGSDGKNRPAEIDEGFDAEQDQGSDEGVRGAQDEGGGAFVDQTPDPALPYQEAGTSGAGLDAAGRSDRVKELKEKLHARYGDSWDKTPYPHAQPAEFVDLLVEACLAERSFDTAYNRFMEFIQQEGVEVEVDQPAMETYMDKLFSVRMKRKMIHALGLGRYEETILQHEIDKLFRAQPFPFPVGTPKK
jgi:hypothetical protein